jgi:hypothetical protein
MGKETPLTHHFQAAEEPRWHARITGRQPMTYQEGPSTEVDRPPHVRAASGLSRYREYIAVIQDDANWLALIDADQQVLAVPLPPSPKGDRVFSKTRGNRGDKYDLEACVTVRTGEVTELLAFSSGSRSEREWLLRVREGEGDGLDLHAEFVPVGDFYRSLRERQDFSGSGLNIEGALTLDEDHIRLFQRGNADPCDGLQPVDATADFSWTELCAHLSDPSRPPPRLENVRTYDLGLYEGVRLTFSDAELLDGGRVLYSASAEDPSTGEIRGSVLGIIDQDGQARWARLVDEEGAPFTGKIEGLTLDLVDPAKVHFVIDDDDEDSPSSIFEALLSRDMLLGEDELHHRM